MMKLTLKKKIRKLGYYGGSIIVIDKNFDLNQKANDAFLQEVVLKVYMFNVYVETILIYQKDK